MTEERPLTKLEFRSLEASLTHPTTSSDLIGLVHPNEVKVAALLFNTDP